MWYEVGTFKEDPHTGMNRLCIENGFDHIFEPKTHEDAMMFTKLEHCKKKVPTHIPKTFILLIFSSEFFKGLAGTGKYVLPGQRQEVYPFQSLLPGKGGKPIQVTTLGCTVINGK